MRGGSGVCRLVGNTDGITFRLHPASGLALDTRPAQGGLRLTVRSTGGAVPYGVIEAVRGATVETTLVVHTLEWMEIPVVAYSLRAPGRRSTRPLASLPRLLEQANAILTPRACISLYPYLSCEAELQSDPGPSIASETPVMEPLFRPLRIPPQSALHVFFVWAIDKGASLDTEGATQEDTFVAMEDNVASPGATLAHEVGHYLGEGHSPSSNDLMYRLDNGGRRISFEQAVRMNARASRYQLPASGAPTNGITLDPIEIQGRR
jgi:hypothetical protein